MIILGLNAFHADSVGGKNEVEYKAWPNALDQMGVPGNDRALSDWHRWTWVYLRDDTFEISKVLTSKAIVNLQKLVRSVPVGEYVIDYAVRLVRATRPKDPAAPDTQTRTTPSPARWAAAVVLSLLGAGFAGGW